MCVCVMYRICDICDVCVGYTVLDRVIGLLLTKYFKRKSLLKLHLPVGDVPFPFPYNWSNNARGYPLSHAARDTTRNVENHSECILLPWKWMTSQRDLLYSPQKRGSVFWWRLYTLYIVYCCYVPSAGLVVAYLAREGTLIWMQAFLLQNVFSCLSRWISRNIKPQPSRKRLLINAWQQRTVLEFKLYISRDIENSII